jgi:hypothetical protein
MCPPRLSSSLWMGATFMKFGRAPTTLSTCTDAFLSGQYNTFNKSGHNPGLFFPGAVRRGKLPAIASHFGSHIWVRLEFSNGFHEAFSVFRGVRGSRRKDRFRNRSLPFKVPSAWVSVHIADTIPMLSVGLREAPCELAIPALPACSHRAIFAVYRWVYRCPK